ncbi:MAG TPA: Ig-like domain-containing protein, partial [Candidatus Faecivicinus avistercoris]|nr:Ig-like domain-containing protein [Candidatus Faecivicinus avistercoris]
TEAHVYYANGAYLTPNEVDMAGVGEFTIGNPSIATVDAYGNVTGVSKGETTLTFKRYDNDATASIRVTVVSKPTEIHLSEEEIELAEGGTYVLSATFGANEMGTVTYESEDPGIAEVAADGTVTAVSEGETTITAKVDGLNGTLTATCVVRVQGAPASIRFEMDVMRVLTNHIFDLPVVVTNADGDQMYAPLTITSSNPSVLNVNNEGKAYGLKTGWATVTATTANGLSATLTVGVHASVSRVELSPDALTLGVGMSQKVEAHVYYANGAYLTPNDVDMAGVGEFASSDPSIAEVDEYGNVTGVSKGTATITFKRFDNGTIGEASVAVVGEPTAIYIDRSDISLGVGMETVLDVTFNPNEYGEVRFSSNATDVATVDQDGKITAVGMGVALITVETYNGCYTYCTVRVINAPDAVTLDITSSNLSIGGTIKLTPTATFEGGSDCAATFTFASSAPSIATVDSEGNVRGVSTGNAVIRVYTQNGLYADCNVTVRPEATSVDLSASEVTIGVGQSATIAARINYRGGSFIFTENDSSYGCFEVDNSSIATVDALTGEITGLNPGSAWVRFRAYNGVLALCQITVEPGAEWIRFSEPFATLSVGQSRTLTCEMSAGSVSTRTYTTSDPEIVEVVGNDATCTIRAVGTGKATITARTSNGQTATCEITVMAEPQEIAFAEDSMTIGLDETAKLPEVTISSDEGECQQLVTYTTDNGNVTVSSTGYVTGLQAGTTVVTATTYNGLTAQCTVHVLPAPSSIEVSLDAAEIPVDGSTQLNVELDAPGNYTVSTSPAGIVEIDGEGVVKALSIGTVTITVETYNGLTDSCTLRVLAVPESVTVEPAELTLGAGMTGVIEANIPANSLGTLVYESENSLVAEVDSQGNVRAVAPGRTEITVSVAGHEDVFDICEVTVLPMPTKIELSQANMALKVGATATLNASATNESGELCYGGVTFESTDPEVVTVDDTGAILAVGEGDAEIVVTSDVNSELTAVCTVVVANALIRFDVEKLTMGVGETYALLISMPDGRKQDFSIESSEPTVASVTEEGLVTALNIGKTTITARNGGDVATCEVTVCERPTSIVLSETERRLVVGSSFQLTATLLPEGSASALTYETDDDSVVRVSKDGTVTAVGYGTATVTVRTYDDKVYATCEVTSVYEPETVRFGELQDIVIAVGDTYELEDPVMYNPNGECDATYTLSVSNSNCARVSLRDGRYVVEALEEGEATLRLRTSNGKTASHTVIVVGAPSSIRFPADLIQMGVGETYAPSVIADNDAIVSVTLESDGPAVRIENGQLYAAAEGTATVTATAVMNPNLTAQVEVEVLAAPSGIQLSATEMAMGVGETCMLETSFEEGTAAVNLEFTSSDERVVRVDRTGLLSAVGVGEAVVRVKTYNGHEAECAITVMKAPTSMTVWPQSITACVEDAVQLTVTFGGDDEFGGLMFDTSDPEIAQVDENGLVTFVKTGSATIFVEAFNGLMAEIPVEVCETPTEVEFVLSSAVILKGDRAHLDVFFDQGAGYYTLKSSDPETVRIAEDGAIEALKLGTVTITLEMPSLGLQADCTVEVIEKLSGIVVVPEADEIEIEGQTQLTYTLLPTNAVGTGLVHFESVHPDIATVDSETGVVTGVSSGTATLCAVAGDGTIGQCTVKVLGGVYRIFTANYSGERGMVGYLPFSKNNAWSMSEAFGGATIDGQQYVTSGMLHDLPKDQLLGSINSFFSETTDNDVSIIYICAHGSYDEYNHYAFWRDGTTPVWADEMMDCVDQIKGKVVLIMDSCYSGGFIKDVESRLAAQSDRVAVLTSAHETTSSCYWSVTSQTQAVDFFTFSLLEGLSYNEMDGLNGWGHGFQSHDEPADSDGDGQITVAELFNYASPRTVELVTGLRNHSSFRGDYRQTPNSYISSEMADLVIFSRP